MINAGMEQALNRTKPLYHTHGRDMGCFIWVLLRKVASFDYVDHEWATFSFWLMD